MRKFTFIIPYLVIASIGFGQTNPLEKLHGKTPGDSVLLVVDSMVISKYGVYIGERNGWISWYPNRPTDLKVSIKGFESTDSISLSSTNKSIEVQTGDSSFEVIVWQLVVLRPGNKSQSVIHKSLYETPILKDTIILKSISVGDIIVIAGAVAYYRKKYIMLDMPAKWYRITN